MARQFAPIVDWATQSHPRVWSNTLLTDVLEGYETDDQYTYTMRLSVPEEDREKLRGALLAKKGDEVGDVDTLLKLLDENDWDVSFIVDCY